MSLTQSRVWIALSMFVVSCGARTGGPLENEGLASNGGAGGADAAVPYELNVDDALCLHVENRQDCCNTDGCAPAYVRCEPPYSPHDLYFSCLSVSTLEKGPCNCRVDQEEKGECVDDICKPLGQQCAIPVTYPGDAKQVCGHPAQDYTYAVCVPPCVYLSGSQIAP